MSSALKSPQKKVIVCNLACESAGVEIDFHQYFKQNGYAIHSGREKADYCLINTCGVTEFGEKLTLNLIGLFRKKLTDKGKIVLFGCLPKINPDFLSAVEAESKNVLLAKKNQDLDEIFSAEYPAEKVLPYTSFRSMYPDWIIRQIKRYKLRCEYNNLISENILRKICGGVSLFWGIACGKIFSKSAAKRKIKVIQTHRGCDNNCSYCGVKKAIKSVRSVAFEKLFDDFKQAIKKGYDFFMIVNEDIGQYGKDIGQSAVRLLDSITALPGRYRIVLRYMHPGWLIDNFEALLPIFKRQKILKVNIPVQSASRRILKLMNRDYDMEKLEKNLLILRKEVPGLIIVSDFIVGFPGEKEEDLAESIRFCRTLDFLKPIIHPFSARPGVSAGKMPGQIPEKEIKNRQKRFNRLRRFNQLKQALNLCK